MRVLARPTTTIPVLLAALVAASSASAQQTYEVTGIVRQSDTASVVSGAEVTAVETSASAVTGAYGRYRLELEPGTYRLVASSLGYAPDTVSVTVDPDGVHRRDFHLEARAIGLEGIVVYGDQVERHVQDLAVARNQRREDLRNYRVTVHRLGLAYQVDPSLRGGIPAPPSGGAKVGDETPVDFGPPGGEVFAFSERVVRQLFVAPNAYAERHVARRASDNFFSEHEVFSTGGGPLDLNEERVDLNLLTEVVSVVGPISEDAPRFYGFTREPADSAWPRGTTEITVEPKSSRRPLFRGRVYVDDDSDQVVGMDLRLNEAGEVSTGLYSVSGFRYYQEFDRVRGYWLPSRTEIRARVGVPGFEEDFVYRDRWVYSGYEINRSDLLRDEIPLTSTVVEAGADSRDGEYWRQAAEQYLDDDEQRAVEEARAYEENRFLVDFFASAFRAWARTPTFLRQSYFTNVSDFYRFNRVEGHYVGAGLRTPAAEEDFAYKVAGGRATGADEWRYYAEARQTLPSTDLAVEGEVYRKTALQFADYRHTVGPLNVDEFRYTLGAGFAGYDPRNYFEREGFRTGLRYRFGQNGFVRSGYMREDHRFLPVVAARSFFERLEVGAGVDPNLNPRVGETPGGTGEPDGQRGFTPGTFSGFDFQIHYDDRQYRQNGVFRNYQIREFGWFTDHLAYWSDPAFGTGPGEAFEYFKYRSSAGVRVPLAATHFLWGEVFVGGSSEPLPAQMQFAGNGFYIEDFIRRRPLLTLGFNEGVGNRVSTARVDYDFGTGLVRLVPFGPIRRSGVQLRLWAAAGLRHPDAGLAPVTPWTGGVDEQVELGVGLTKILGIFSVQLGFRVHGDAGDAVGVRLII